MWKEANDNPIVRELVRLGSMYGWGRPEHQPENVMLSLFKEDMRINIYYTTMTVATCLNHPTKGKTQLFRRNVNSRQLVKIFENPRVHTFKGYYERRK